METVVVREDRRIASLCAGAFLFLSSSFLGISLLLAIFSFTDTRNLLSVPGNILFSVYGFSSFLVPVLILYAAILLFLPGGTLRSKILLAGSIIPFFTVVGAEKLLGTIGETIGNETTGRLVSIGIALSALLAILIEYLLLLQLGDRFKFGAPQAERFPTEEKKDEAVFFNEQFVEDLSVEESSVEESIDDEVSVHEYDELLPHESFIEKTAPEEPTYVDFQKMKAPFDFSDDDEETMIEELPAKEDLLKHEVIVNPDDKDFPPVVSVPPPVHEAAPGGETSMWKKKHRGVYSVPSDILTSYPDGEYWIVDEATRHAAASLKETLNEFSIQADVTGIRKGPVITMFEILPASGVKLSRIVGLQDNIALRLAASSVRIVAPIPGKHAVGIEVPNQKRSIVSFRELIETETPASKKMEIPVVLGKDITGEAQILDLALTPHLLIAGSTGSGKSVCVNAIILSILYKRSPEDVKMILIDPKIVELKLYNDIAHLLSPVITEPKKAFQALQYCLCEMERRYSLLDGMGVRDIKSYNRRIKERNIATEKLPYLVVIIDEFADLMATTGKELESTVARLCAMSRAVGLHLVLATQRPSIDVITGLIKANIPSRIAFMVASKMDSRIIIDQVGAEKLLGRGDMLYSSATDPFPVRIQGAFVSEEDVERVVSHVKTLGAPEYIDEEIFVEDDDDGGVDPSLFSGGEDPLYDKALEIVLLAGKASASYIQRRLKIGYNRAARLVEDMESRGIVGPANGSKPREVVHHP